jgi:hypothetical protein
LHYFLNEELTGLEEKWFHLFIHFWGLGVQMSRRNLSSLALEEPELWIGMAPGDRLLRGVAAALEGIKRRKCICDSGDQADIGCGKVSIQEAAGWRIEFRQSMK